MTTFKDKIDRRKARVRRTLRKRAAGRPRLSVHRSSKNIYAQVIDDAVGKTLASASTLEKDLKGSLKTGADMEAATAVGKLLAERAIELASKRSSSIGAPIFITVVSRRWRMPRAKAA